MEVIGATPRQEGPGRLVFKVGGGDREYRGV
jgi:hypothetical protein